MALDNPLTRQWLDLLAYAEGTDSSRRGGGYDVMFGGGRFQDFSKHPDVVIRTKGFPEGSAAAGRYQFMPGTYAAAQKALGLQGFGPREQDLAAIYLMKRRGVDPTKDPITPQTIAKLAPEWASLPTLQGRSYYGQPVKSLSELQGFLQKPSGGVPYQVQQDSQAAGVTPISLPRYDFQGALKNIVTQYALSGAAQPVAGDTQKAQVYLQAAEAIKADPEKYGEEGLALAEQYKYKANEALFLGGSPGGNDPSKLVMDILGAKMTQKAYDSSQASQEALINSQLSSSGAPASTPSSFEKPASVVYEQSSGQPGVDLYFPSKRFPAVLGGVVKDVSREGGYGNYVVVESLDPLTNKKVDVLYGHLADKSVLVRPGQQIAPGQIIGQQGGTGNVRSADGTIASIDFLAPRGAGSRDMTPYSNFDQLRRHIVSTFQGGAGR